FVARAARLDALADPDFLLRPEAVELAVGDRFRSKVFLFLFLVNTEISRITSQNTPVQFQDARGDAVEEGAVVGDDDARRMLDDQILQYQDSIHIEVVGRLVQQEEIGLLREGK